jgi:hypothetical protein
MCECKVAGKFEGEPALGYLLWADGFADESTDQRHRLIRRMALAYMRAIRVSGS